MNYSIYTFIALGGALGALGRYLLSTFIHSRSNLIFPLGTLSVNVLGSFLLGLIYVLGTSKLIISPNIRAFLGIGLLGAFTTFSTFSLETLNMIKDGEIRLALLNAVGSLILGLLAVWLGTIAGQLLSR
ncbi:MAG: fluoride efflux transporter CrcB [Firmicutes bacterium HGW-Firmicutes-12]|jgi:CrcB protein|nr:MAG: fluoride efflux transporter CrcB [Firmicutes bacterium HGW-Firmicutes-12]